MTKFIYSLLILGLVVFSPGFAMAEEDDTATESEQQEAIIDEESETADEADNEEEEIVSEEADEDEEITASDLEISEPRMLPDSRLYFLKNFWRGVDVFFTFNQVKKAEKRMRHADEKLIEAKKIAEKTGNEHILAKAMERYDRNIDRIAKRMEKIKKKSPDDPKFQKLLDKFTEKQFKHQRLIDKLEAKMENAPDEVKERFSKAREKAIARFGESMHRIDGDKMGERLERMSRDIKGSGFKHLKNLEVLKRLEEKLPEEALPAIRRAQENAMKRFQKNLEDLDPEEAKDKLGRYMRKIHGNEARHLEILEDLKARKGTPKHLLETIDFAKKKPLMKIKAKIKTKERKLKKLRKIDKAKNLKKPEVHKKRKESKVCAQVITPARNIKTKKCRIFRNSCLEAGWKLDRSCNKNSGARSDDIPKLDASQ